MKAVLVMPIAEVGLVMTGLAAFTVKVKVALPVPLGLDAPRLTVKFPTWVGVPVIAPVAVLTIKLEGRPVA